MNPIHKNITHNIITISNIIGLLDTRIVCNITNIGEAMQEGMKNCLTREFDCIRYE